MLRNAVSKFRVRRSKSGVVQRLNAALRRRRFSDALGVATFVAALVYGSVDNSNAYAQFFQSNAQSAQRSRAPQTAQPNARRGGTAAQTPLFSGKFARSVSEKFSRGDETQKQNATRRYAQTPERGGAGRSPYPTAPGSSAVRAPLTQRPSNVPNRAPASGYAAPFAAAPFAAAPPAAKSADALAQPSTSRESAQEALAKIPWQTLSPSAREKLAALAKNPTIYRRLPMAGGYCNPELFDFFLTHPHAVVGLWRQMGYDDVAMAPVGPNVYSVREKTGTVGRAQILYQDDELTLVYCSGKYQGPVVPRSLDGEMFLVLQTRYTEDPTGRPIVVCRLDAFVDLKNPGADLLARTFSGALGKLADSNFEQTLAFIDNVSQTAETNPGALSGSIAGLSELSPEARRLFAAKTSETARQAQLRARGTYVDYRLLPKLNSPTPTVARVLSRERSGAADVAIAARARTVEPTPGAPIPPAFNAAATSSRAGLGVARSPLSRTPSTFNDFDKPSLAQNSFALSDDSESDFDFEAELDWEEEETIKVGGARVAPQPISSAPTLVPETSVAKAAARPATRFSDALNLIDSNANDDESGDYATELLAADQAPTLATDDEEISTDASPLLLDFETELLEETEKTNAKANVSSVAKPAPLAALSTENAADAIALPGAASAESNADASSLPVLVFDDAPEAETPTVSDASTPNETATLDDVPLLLLPEFEPSNAAPESPKKTAAQPSAKVALKNDLTPLKARGRVVAPIVPKTKKTPVAQPSKPEAKTATPVAQPAPAPAPVWRAVDAKPAKTQAQAAPPIAETARVATEKGATFRKPELH
ncbi:MAG: hypothetical protein J6K25_03615 [Thermoguttaceae bacterium]|nr:hypothetical protein [Thermoguttaceae bacterium]